MNYTLDDLRAFIAVTDGGSFHAAATAIHLSQPALSRRIGKLEAALGVRLFDRTTRKVTLTPVGLAFSEKAAQLINGLEQALLGIDGLADKVSREVTVACVPSAVRYFLPNVLREYHRKYPHILVRVVDEGASEVLAAVASGGADFGLNYIGTQEPQVDFEPILNERFVLACRRDHPLANKKKVSWAQIDQTDYMTVTSASGNRILLDQALAAAPGPTRWFCEVRHVLTLVGLVEAGVGIAVVPRLAMPRDDHPLLVSVPIVGPEVQRTIGLLRRRGRTLAPAAQQLYDMIYALRSKQFGTGQGKKGKAKGRMAV